MIRSILHTLGGILLLFSLSLSTARYIEAQVANSTVTGRITDSSDALVSGAQVTLIKTDTKLVIKTPTTLMEFTPSRRCNLVRTESR